MEPHVATWGPLRMEAYTLPCSKMDPYDLTTSSNFKTKEEGYILSCRDMDLYDIATSSQKKIKNEEQALSCCDMNCLHDLTSKESIRPPYYHVITLEGFQKNLFYHVATSELLIL